MLADDSEVHSVAGSREPSREVELHVGGRLRPGDIRSEDFESDFRLAQSSAEVDRRPAGWDRLGIVREVLIVGAAQVAERIHQHDAVKTRPVLGRTLDFGLVLLIDFRADQRSGFFQLLNTFFERGGGLGRRCAGRSRSAARRHLRANWSRRWPL
jgi:hypothetical protein